MLSFSKLEIKLVLKYQDAPILLFLTFTYLTAVFSGLRTLAVLNEF